MTRLLIAPLCLVLLLALAGCGEVPAPGGATEPKAVPEATASPEAAPGEVPVGPESDGQEVSVALGSILKVSLPSNPSTGFSWGVAQVDAAFLQQEGEAEYVPSSSGALGAGGQAILRFRAVQAGRTALVLEYRRSWETGVAPQDSFTLQVVVR